MNCSSRHLWKVQIVLLISLMTSSDLTYTGAQETPSENPLPVFSARMSVLATRRPNVAHGRTLRPQSSKPDGSSPRGSRLPGSLQERYPSWFAPPHASSPLASASSVSVRQGAAHVPSHPNSPNRVSLPSGSSPQRYQRLFRPKAFSWPLPSSPSLGWYRSSVPGYTMPPGISPPVSLSSGEDYPSVFSSEDSLFASSPESFPFGSADTSPPRIQVPSPGIPSHPHHPHPPLTGAVASRQQLPLSQPHIPPNQIRPPYRYRPMR